VALSALEPRANVDGYFDVDTINAYRITQKSFAQISMYSGAGLRVETQSGVFADASAEAVSQSYFDLVGARPSAGRVFTEADGAVVVISEGFRQRLFGSAPGIGEAIKVNALPAAVIGVVADGFHGLQLHGTTDILVPFAVMQAASGDASRPFRSRVVVGRLARGVSIEAARAELLARWPSVQAAKLPAALPDTERQALLRQRLTVAPLASGFSALRDRYGFHALGAPGADGDPPGGRVRQPCGPHAGAVADAPPPDRDSPRAGWKRAARVLAAARRRSAAVDGGIHGCAPARVGNPTVVTATEPVPPAAPFVWVSGGIE
jgi:hypothetical protein